MLKGKNAMKGEMERKTVYGNENFIKKLSREYGVAGVIRSKGRPRKDGAKRKENRPFLFTFYEKGRRMAVAWLQGRQVQKVIDELGESGHPIMNIIKYDKVYD